MMSTLLLGGFALTGMLSLRPRGLRGAAQARAVALGPAGYRRLAVEVIPAEGPAFRAYLACGKATPPPRRGTTFMVAFHPGEAGATDLPNVVLCGSPARRK
ncbi:hypothetical protein [Paracraurococcus lichenis]|uniref:DUF3592 domain-containing protein n=1 Tax=Paracraurococcus lichenis TaxID=3064888 RepID=A0ABT9E657_9PROT|nr:hypothetical protein [Paracraurococcus sp. LOR1-02]MDO9711623.1 hypothetical protein [Paracraurococcus sp. LOR1-02]